MPKLTTTDDNSDSQKNDKDDGTNMKSGMIVTSPKHAYVIIKLLAEEDLGAVHNQTHKNTSGDVGSKALKIENGSYNSQAHLRHPTSHGVYPSGQKGKLLFLGHGAGRTVTERSET
ncbi:hypothetical protein M3Y94_00411400 [Aphelenchoides besseyi]|nr:hypothetical protein M3Y94_00411400 [Aphelenchoides besseyi]KAI6229644.1 hypothetical protein M3Y95_00552600 [Aphelenchoides besseyi]